MAGETYVSSAFLFISKEEVIYISGSIKGITVEINGEATGLNSALSSINSNSKSLNSELSQINKLLKLDPTNVILLQQKQELLTKAIENSNDKLTTLKSVQEQVNQQFANGDIGEEQYRAFTRQVESTEIALKNLESQQSGLGSTSSSAGSAVNDLGNDLDSTSGKATSFGTILKANLIGDAIVAGVKAIGGAIKDLASGMADMVSDTASAGDEVDKMSQKLGLSAEAYQEWDYVLSQSGVDITSLETGMKTLTNNIDDLRNSTGDGTSELEQLGISIEDVNTLSREEIFEKTISALQNVSDETEKATIANDLFGKSGQSLLPLLNQSNVSTEELMAQIQELGYVMSDEAVQASVDFTDAQDNMTKAIEGVSNSIGAMALPALTNLMGSATDAASAFSSFFSGDISADEFNSELVGIVENVVETISSALPEFLEIGKSILSTLIEGIGQVLPTLIEAAGQIITTLITSIISILPKIFSAASGIINELVSSLIRLLPDIISTGMQILISLINGIASELPTLIPMAVEAIITIVQGLVDNIPLLIDAALQLITGLATGLIDAIPVLIEALPTIIDSLITSLLENIPLIIQAGIDLLTSLVTALPEIISAIVEVLPEIINSIITALLDNLPLIVQAGIKLLVALVQALPQIITTIVQAMPKIVDSVITALLDNIPLIIDAGVQLLVALVENLPEIIAGIITAIPEIVSAIVDAFGSYFDTMADVGTNLIKGVWQGISDAGEWLWNKIRGFFAEINARIRNFFGIASPSTVFAEMGGFLAEGLGEGFVNQMSSVSSAITNALPTNFSDLGVNFNGTYTASGSNTGTNTTKNYSTDSSINFGGGLTVNTPSTDLSEILKIARLLRV